MTWSERIRFGTEDGLLCLIVQDNGRGFDPATAAGHGLVSMRARAQRMGGSLQIANLNGTTVALTVPLRSRPVVTLLKRYGEQIRRPFRNPESPDKLDVPRV